MGWFDRPEFGPNVGLVDEVYRQYLDDPTSVSEAWREFFAEHDLEEDAESGDSGETVAPAETTTEPSEENGARPGEAEPRTTGAGATRAIEEAGVAPPEAKPAQAKPEGAKTTQRTEAKPAAPKPAQAKPAEARTAEAEAKPAEAEAEEEPLRGAAARIV